MRQAVLLKTVWVPSETPFTFEEKKNPETGEARYILSGLLLPFNKISRNNVLYNRESCIEKHKDLIGRPLMYNHKVDGEQYPKGHFIDSWIEDDGWHYKADLDPAEVDFIRKLERKDLRHVSIQLLGGRVVERMESGTNRTYTEAWVNDVIEASVVPAPGFLDTTSKFAECLGMNCNTMNEDITTSTDAGAIGTKLAGADKKDCPKKCPMKEQYEDKFNGFPMDQFHKGLNQELSEHPGVSPTETAQLVLDHLKEDPEYYNKQEAREAEDIVEEVGEDETMFEMVKLIEQYDQVKSTKTPIGDLELQKYNGFGYLILLNGQNWTYVIQRKSAADEIYELILDDAKVGTVRSPFTYN